MKKLLLLLFLPLLVLTTYAYARSPDPFLYGDFWGWTISLGLFFGFVYVIQDYFRKGPVDFYLVGGFVILGLVVFVTHLVL